MTHHLRAEHISDEMRECIENCANSHDVCMETLAHCLDRGGQHAAPAHIGTLMDCAQACDASRDFMLRGSELHPAICGICADACQRCAESCEAIGPDDQVMQNCAEMCRRCAASCRSMAGAHVH